MKLELYAISKRGAKNHNEDYCGYVKGISGFLACLADGLGGHAGGQTASRIAVTAALSSATTEESAHGENALTNAFNAAQWQLLSKQREMPQLKHMRTTFTGFFIQQDGTATYAHAGDSRIYIIRDRKIVKQTLDHSIPQVLVATGNLDQSEIRGHTYRNQILHSLGDPQNFQVEYAPEYMLEKGDVILMCSDGFWEYVTENEMTSSIYLHTTAKRWIRSLEEKLLQKTEKLENDNYSALAIYVREI